MSKRFALLVVILVTVFVRGALLFYVAPTTLNLELITLNGEVARNFAEGRGLTIDKNRLKEIYAHQETTGRLLDPEDGDRFFSSLPDYEPFSYVDELGYPLFLGVLWKLIGIHRYFIAGLFQIFLSGIAAFAVFQFSRKYFSLPVAFLAGLMYAFFIFEANFSVLAHQYALVGHLVVFFIWVLSALRGQISTRKNIIFSLLLGLILSVSALTRSTLLLLPLIALICVFLRMHWKASLLSAIIFLFIFSVTLTPLYLRNIELFGEGRLSRRVFWHSIATGLGQFPNPWRFLPIDGSISDFIKKKYPGVTCCGAAYEEKLKQEILPAIKENPLWYIGTVLERVPLALFPFHFAMIRGKVGQELQGTENIFFAVPYGFWSLLFALLASIWSTLALLGCWMLRKRWVEFLPLFLLWIYFIGVHSALYVHPNYFAPLSFLQAIFSAFVLVEIYKNWHAKRSLLSSSP